MKKTLIAVSTALLACLSLAEPVYVDATALKQKDAIALLSQKCSERCIVMDDNDILTLNKKLNEIVQQKIHDAIIADRRGST